VFGVLTAILLFAMASGINTASVLFEQRNRWLTSRFGARAWPVHMAIITPGWVAFLTFETLLGNWVHWDLPEVLRPAGVVRAIGAGALFAASILQLGIRKTFNGYFFASTDSAPVSGGIFRWLANPMYDSFWLAFVGIALFRANAIYLVLAAASYLLLNRCEATVENRPFSPSRSG